MTQKIFLLLFLFFLLTLFPFSQEYLYSQSSKKRARTDSEINLFCRDIEPQHPYCVKWLEIWQKRLELESILHHEIKNFCQENPHNIHCKRASKISIFTFCAQLAPENNNCILWKNIKQAELEVKGTLSEEIQRFCQNNPQNILCKSKIK